MLGGVDTVTARVDRDAIGIANARGITLRGGELLSGFVGIEGPETAARLELGAGFDSR